MRSKTSVLLGGVALILAAAPAAAGCYGPQCYQRVNTPPQFATVAETVQVRPAAVARHVSPAQYGTVAEHVVVRPAQTVARVVPPVHSTVAEKVMVSPGGKQWQVTRDAYGREIGCWVHVPPQYAVQHRTVVVHPGRVVHETIPGVTAVRHRTVMTKPAQVHEEVIPAQYATQHRTVMTHPGSSHWQPLRQRGW